MTAGPRIGILGGTLDPVHLGHVEVARAARAALDLERVIVMPTRVPPHRQDEPAASGHHRFAMAALCAADHDWMTVSRRRTESSGAVIHSRNTRRLAGRRARSVLAFFITGAECLQKSRRGTAIRVSSISRISPWSRARAPGRLARLAVAGAEIAIRHSRHVEGRGGETAIFLIETATPDISSTDIRRRLAAGAAVTGLVCPAVERHIARHHLYEHGHSADHLHG